MLENCDFEAIKKFATLTLKQVTTYCDLIFATTGLLTKFAKINYAHEFVELRYEGCTVCVALSTAGAAFGPLIIGLVTDHFVSHVYLLVHNYNYTYIRVLLVFSAEC